MCGVCVYYIPGCDLHVPTFISGQLFAGDYPEGPQAFCNNPATLSLVECLNGSMVRLRITTSREFLPNTNYSPSIMVPTVW